MAQIKVLNLNSSDSLSELSYKDAIKINGGSVVVPGLGHTVPLDRKPIRIPHSRSDCPYADTSYRKTPYRKTSYPGT